ncbi:hypothetical protein B7463_g7064, partial [Scytalidium lignicola]
MYALPRAGTSLRRGNILSFQIPTKSLDWTAQTGSVQCFIKPGPKGLERKQAKLVARYARKAVTTGRIQNNKAQIRQMRGTKNLKAAAYRYYQNNIIATLALALIVAHGLGSPCRIALTWISPIDFFYVSRVTYIIPAPNATLALVLTPLALTPNPPVLTTKLQVTKVKKLGKDFQGIVIQALKLTRKQHCTCRVYLWMELTMLEATSNINNK